MSTQQYTVHLSFQQLPSSYTFTLIALTTQTSLELESTDHFFGVQVQFKGS